VKSQFISAFFLRGHGISAASVQRTHGDGVRIHSKLLYSNFIKIVQPTYPELARQTHVERRVSLACLIDTDELVERIELEKGHLSLIQAATQAASQWKFRPLQLNGKAVETETTVNIDF
jgi:TonB family protein